MKKKFKDYFKENKVVSKALFKKRGSYIKYYMFYVMKLLATVFIPLLPIINVAEQRMLRNIKKEERIDLCKNYRGTDNPKNYFTYIASSGFKYLMILSGVLVIALAGGLVFLIAMSIDMLIRADGILAIVSVVPFGILILVALFLVGITMVPVAYIIDSANGINMSKVLHESFNALWKDGKWQKLISYVMHSLIILGFTLGFALPVMLPVLIDPSAIASQVISTLLFAALLVPYLRAIAKFDILFKLYRFDIYEEHVRDIFDVSKRISGIEIDEATIKSNKSMEAKLSTLFDSTKNREVKSLINTSNSKSVNIKEFKDTELAAEKSANENVYIKQDYKDTEKSEIKEETVAEEVVIDNLVTEESKNDKPIAEEPVIEEPIIDEPIAEEPVIEEPIIDEPIAEELVIEEPIIDEPIAEEPVIEEPKNAVKPKKITVRKPKLKKKLDEDLEKTKEKAQPEAIEKDYNDEFDSDLTSLFDDELMDDAIEEPVDTIGEDDMDLAQDSSLDNLINEEKEEY